jgi:hypothetical protein
MKVNVNRYCRSHYRECGYVTFYDFCPRALERTRTYIAYIEDNTIKSKEFVVSLSNHERLNCK